jgi:hypothetical protein
MLNEMEIISWCYTIYLILGEYHIIEQHLQHIGRGSQSIVKFCHPEELVLACAIFAKVILVLNDFYSL